MSGAAGNELVFWRLVAASYTLGEINALVAWANELERLTRLERLARGARD